MDEDLPAADAAPSIAQRLAALEAGLAGLSEQLRALQAPEEGLPYVTIAQMRERRDRVWAEAMIRARCMVVPIDSTTALCRILGRYKIHVDRRDVGFAPHLMFEGFWEYWLTEFIWRNVRPGDVALDVGANHGYYALLMADLCGPDGMVHAFEPNPRMVELMRATMALNGFWNTVKVHPVAVAAAAGPALRFLASDTEPKNGRLLKPGELAGRSGREGDQLISEVPAVPLDDAVPGRVDFVKIDVEGAEDLAWRGMQAMIARNPDIRIVMEFNAARMANAAEMLAEIAAGFTLRELRFDGQVHDCTAEDVLGRREDTLLYISRQAPR